MTNTKLADWRGLVVQADPEYNQQSVIQTEYEFTTKNAGKPQTHERGRRVFKGRYKERGPYSD